MRRDVFFFVAMAMACFLPVSAQAAVIQIPAGKDNTLYESGTGHLSNGAGNYFFAGRTAQPVGQSIRRGLVWFDVQHYLPPGANVTSAVLRLHMSKTPTGTQNITIHPVLTSWGEGASNAGGEEGAGAAAATGDATWLHRFHSTVLWSSAGGDFGPVAVATTAVTAVGSYQWSSPQLLAHVQSIVDGATANHGFLIRGNESVGTTAKRFDSRENATVANRPVLIIGYERPVVEPGERITHTARLLPESEVPPAVNDFVGAAAFAYDRSTRTLNLFMIHNVTNANGAHIHGPAGVGNNAGIVIGLSTAMRVETQLVLSASQETNLLAGLYYVNVHNPAFGGGAIRGQIVVNDHFGAALTGDEEVPPAANDFFGIGLFSYDRSDRTLDYFVVHDVTNANAAHIHGFAPFGENAGIVVDLGSGVSPIRGSATLNASQEAALKIEHLYINVHSPDFLAGAIRGQIRPIDPLSPVTHTARLQPGQEVPPAANNFSGIGLFSLDRLSGRLKYFIQHDVTNATMAHIHGPAGVGTNAGIIIDFGFPTNPITGTAVISPLEADQLLRGLWYVNVHSSAEPGGAIRGQIRPDDEFFTHLIGRSETPPKTVNETGAGLFQYNHVTRELTYRIEHDVGQPTVAHIHGPAVEGIAAPPIYTLNSATSPIAGSVVFTPADELNLFKGRLYVNVHSVTYPGGVLRGQILAAEPSLRATMTAAITPDQETPPLTNDFSGTAVLQYDRDSRLLSWFVEHNVEDMTAVHIHGPAAPGTPAGIVFDMGGPANPIQGRRVLTPAQEAHLLNGLYYINIHNPTYPPGAIRGQILSGDRFHATLQGRREAVSTPATGAGIFSYDYPTRTLSWRVEHSVEAVSAAHIHGPAQPGVSAGIVIGFPDPASPITGSTVLTAEQEQNLLAGLYYVNVHSPTHGPGEIRGQILEVDPVPAYTHSAILAGDQEVPPVTNNFSGVGLFAYDCVNRILKLEIHHTVSNASAAHIHGPAGTGGVADVLFEFNAPHSPIIECLTLTPAQDLEFRGGQWYVNVHSPAFTNGAVRGQILPGARLHCVLEGREQETPGPITTAARGLGVFMFTPATTQLVYHIEHTVTNTSNAHIHGPAARGVGASPVIQLPLFSPITGSTNLTEQQVVELFRGLYYVNIHSPTHGPGEIRGQIIRSLPDTGCNGIDDFWELDYGLVPGGYDSSLDLDGDGFTVVQEHIADTDPQSSNSFPRVSGIDRGESNEVSFATSPFRLYSTDRTTNLVQGLWTPMQAEPFWGTGGLMSVPVTNGLSDEYFRLNIFLP